MTTGYVLLPIPGGIAPDGSGTVNNPARLEKVVSSGAQTTNAPKLTYYGLLFSPTTDEHWIWNFQLPSDWASGGTIRLKFSNKGTSANGVTWKAAIVGGFTSDWDAEVYGTVSTTNATPSATTGIYVNCVITPAADQIALAGNQLISIMVGRDPDNASDTNASDMRLEAATFEYTTT